MDPPQTGLVVPIDVEAFCVGASDAARTNGFAGATVDYSLLTARTPEAFLGGSATRGFQDALVPLDPGVHVHWALPDALTRADASGGALAFPAVPNRWLVTRLVIAGKVPVATSFIVESDQIGEEKQSDASVLIPVLSPDGPDAPPDFRYLGSASPLTAVADDRGRPRLRDANGTELTAVANGTPSFAAYYPESRNSFGFFDPLADLPAAAELMYVVTGWYDAPQNDPAVLAAAERDGEGRPVPVSRSRKWSSEGEADYTLYGGVIQGIVWNQGTAYIPEVSPTISADLAIANSPSEALAAYFANQSPIGGADPVLTEQLLTAFQLGLWPKLSQPAPDMLAKLREALHDSQFAKVDSGAIYSIHQVIGGSDREAIALPSGIAAALDALNQAAAAQLQANNELDGFRWRAFADWYRYFLSETVPEQDAVYDHFLQTLNAQWPAVQQAAQDAATTSAAALAVLNGLLESRPDLSLRQEPGARYLRPNDPALLLRSPDLAMPARYGGDGAHQSDGTLACRTTDQLVSAVTISGTSIGAGDFAAATSLPGVSLPYAADCSNLLAEACLLNSTIAAAWAGTPAAQLQSALEALLAGGDGSPWTIQAGTAPSPVELNWWEGNPWLPVFLSWSAGYAPLCSTVTAGVPASYAPDVLTSNFAIDPAAASFVDYCAAGPNAVDPAKADYSQGYDGSSILSARAAGNFAAAIEQYLATNSDPVLGAILTELQQSPFMVQPLAGFSDKLLNREPMVQAALVVPDGAGSQATALTAATAGIVATGSGPVTYHVTPNLDDPFNPFRAGWFQLNSESLSLVVVDAFGQKRPIQFGSCIAAASMAATAPGGTVEPGFAALPPRLAQPARLLFQWLSAADGTTVEYNGHPAQSPICGWILPNHLTGGFFLYAADGRPIGSMFVAGDDSEAGGKIVWQGAPGDDVDIDCTIASDPVLASANPQLHALAMQLGTQSSVADFQAFYAAVDAAHGSINPANAATDAGLAVLIGRPMALVQAQLRLDLQGQPYLNQNSACMQDDDPDDPWWMDTDAGVAGLQLPVVLGDLDQLDDGLIGYFKGSAGGGFDLGTFYSEAAEAGIAGAVVQPTQTTLLLAPTPAADPPLNGPPPPPPSEPMRVLMLVDPRAPIHAITGILPTQSLLVPPDLAGDALGTLEFSIAVAPVLRSAAGLVLPTPRETGFALSFLEQRKDDTGLSWLTLPDIGAGVGGAVWTYTPQTLTEGWLRFNPSALTAELVDPGGQPVAAGGAVQAMTLRLVNRKPVPITFAAGNITPEGEPSSGSIFYVHFGALVAPADVGSLSLTAPGWTFALQTDDVYGAYFAATVSADTPIQPAGDAVTPAEGSIVEIAVTGLNAATAAAQAFVHVDYYRVQGISDGVAISTVSITSPPPQDAGART